MELKVNIDLTRYTDNEVLQFWLDNLITREEFDQWRATKPVESTTVSL